MESNPLDLIDKILSGGLQSKRLTAYLDMRRQIIQKIGDDAAPIFSVQQVRDAMLTVMKQEIVRQYKHNQLLCSVACLFYGSEITVNTPMTDLAKMASNHPGSDFGLQDLDALGELVSAVTGRDITLNGNLLRYSSVKSFGSIESVRDFIQQHGGRV